MGVISRMTMRVFAIVLFLSASSGVFAGQLILKNTSSSPITCTVDGWTRASGGSFDWFIKVEPGQSFYVGQNTSRPNPPVINWANCNSGRRILLPAVRRFFSANISSPARIQPTKISMTLFSSCNGLKT